MNTIKRFFGLFLTSPWISLILGSIIYVFLVQNGVSGLFLFGSLLVAMIPIGLILIYFRGKLEEEGVV